MKKIIFLFIVLILISSFVIARETKNSPDDLLRFDLISYSPSPVQAGDSFDATIKIKNIGDETINNFKIDLNEKFPFTSTSSENSKSFDIISPDEEKTIKFNLKTNRNVDEGSEKIHFSYIYDNYNKITVAENFNINIEDIGKLVSIDSVETIPERIFPGQPAALIIDIENSERSILNDIKVKINLTEDFSLLFSTNEQSIKSLKPGENAEVIFDIITNADTASKPYNFPLEIEYFDEGGTKFLRANKIGLIVDAPPQYELNLEDSDLLTYGTKNSLTLSISNVAPSNIRFLSINLLPTKDYKVISNTKKYLGNLEPDDFETAEYQVFFNNCIFSCSKKINLKLGMEFKDDFNKDFEVTENIPVRIFKKSEAKNLGAIPEKNSLNYILIIIILIFVYYAIKDYRKEKNITKAIKYAFIATILSIFKFISLFKWRNLKRLPRKIRTLWARANDK